MTRQNLIVVNKALDFALYFKHIILYRDNTGGSVSGEGLSARNIPSE